MLLTLPALLLGAVVLGIGLRRARLASWLPLILWAVGIGTFIGTEFTVKGGEIIGIATASLALVLIARAASAGLRTAQPDPVLRAA